MGKIEDDVACTPLLPGDIVLFANRSWISRTICWFERSPGEAPSVFSHVGAMVDPRRLCEALWTVKVHDVVPRVALYCRAGGTVEVWRDKTLTEAMRHGVSSKLLTYRGRRYGPLKIVAHGLDRLLGGAYMFRRLCRMDRYPVCYWVVTYAYDYVQRGFGVDPAICVPDDIHDACVADLSRFELVARWSSDEKAH